MNRMLAWFASNSVAANLMMLGILAGGLFTMTSIRTEVFPELQLDVITISVLFPGGTPAEIEDGICEPIERELESIEGIKRITSAARENVGIVTLELEASADMRETLDRVKTRVDGITSFPDDAEKPVVTDVVVRNLVLNVAVSGKAPERSIKELGERVR
ncbi:MAG: efflux RND transporter permease subunit [Planctomycetota bacterium]